MAVIALLVELVARDDDLLGVHDDDEIARVHVRRVDRLALAAQRVGDLGRQPSEGLTLGVDDVPVARDLSRLGCVGLHKTESDGPSARRGRIVAKDGSGYSIAGSGSG
jgi:hypothetical protein